MRSLNSNVLAVGVLTVAASASSGGYGCSGSKVTELVPGALTQVQVPEDLAAIQVLATVNGVQKFCQNYTVTQGEVELPASIGFLAGQGGSTAHITIRGYDTANSDDLNNCYGQYVDQPAPSNSNEVGPSARVLRQATVTFTDQQTLFLPMQLNFSCYDVDCSSGGTVTDQTCKANTCQSDAIDSNLLVAYDPSLLDGTQECFDPTECMAATEPALSIDDSNCTYTVPPDLATAAQSGYNVRLTYTDYSWVPDPATGVPAPVPSNPIETEILSVDPLEGFSIPDSTQPLNFTLGAGLCKLVQAAADVPATAPASGHYHTISNVDVAPGCPAKADLLPFCAAQQHDNVSSGATPAIACGVAVPLESTPSAIYVAMDNSGSMYGAFGPQGYATAMNLSFGFPVFKHTYVAFDFLSKDNECGASPTSYTSPLIPFGLAPAVQPQVAQELNAWTAPDTAAAPQNLYLLAAMQVNSGVYASLTGLAQKFAGDGGPSSGLNVAAAMFFVNRIPTFPAVESDAGGEDAGGPTAAYPETAGECNPAPAASVQDALVAQAIAAKTQNVNTYFVVLNDQQGDGATTLGFYNSVASASTGAASVVDATSTQPEVVLGNFQSTLASIATCSYELPAGVDTTASLTFTAPANTPAINPTPDPIAFPVSQNSGCTASTATGGTGWNIDQGRILLCGASCTQVEETIAAVTAAALSSLEPADGGTEAGLPTGDAAVPVVPDVPVQVTMPCAAASGP